jgi:hypothetical protein
MGDTTHCLAMSDKSKFKELADEALKKPLDAVAEDDIEKLDTEYEEGDLDGY